MKLMETNRPMS